MFFCQLSPKKPSIPSDIHPARLHADFATSEVLEELQGRRPPSCLAGHLDGLASRKWHPLGSRLDADGFVKKWGILIFRHVMVSTGTMI